MPLAMLWLALATLRVEGTVRDAAGAAVPGAHVVVEAAGARAEADADAQGHFALDWPGPLPARVSASAPGLAPRTWPLAAAGAPLDLRLSPATFADAVTVTASRRDQRVADVPAAVSVLDAGALAVSAAPAVDEALRQVPGFALYRRSGSRTANPTSQGVTFRGLGGSAASRAIVFDDGLPLNDAFGGWVQWSRVPLGALERVEVLRGGGSSLYGTGALAGVVQLVRRDGGGRGLDADLSAGSLGTRQVSLFAREGSGAWAARLAGEGFDTGGYVAVRPEDRGPVDSEVASRHLSLDLTLEHAADAGRAFARGAYYDDERENGTPLQDNDCDLWQAAAGLDRPLAGGAWSARAYGGHELYRQTFTAIDEQRLSERLTRLQQVPVDAGGLALQWTRPLARHVLLAGLDARAVRGTSEEEAVTPAGRVPYAAGGSQRSGAAFLEDTWAPDERWRLSLGGRFDAWRNFDAHQDGPAGSVALPARSETAFSPRVAVQRRFTPALALSASAYRSFRGPTLNELYRSFRVGNVVTNGNALLRAERLGGVEASGLFAAGRFSGRLTGFWMVVDDTIANVTLSTTPALVTRQRQNLGRIRSRGLELEGELHPGSGWTLTGALALTDATVREFESDPSLEGLRLAQVPRQAGAVGVRRDGRRVTVAAQARWCGEQFEDDLNTLPLAAAFNLDAFAGYAVSPRWQIFAALENALDSDQEIGRTPVVTLAPPRSFRAGLRLRLGAPPPAAAGTGVAPH